MILIQDGYMIDPKSGREGNFDLLIDGDKIVKIAENIEPKGKVTRIDAEGLLIAPGLVDVHVHFRDPGFTAKEAVVSTLTVLLGTSTANLGAVLGGLFTPISAVSFLAFTLLYTPCVAAVATIRRELGSRIATVGVVIMQCGVAWIVSFAIYTLLGFIF